MIVACDIGGTKMRIAVSEDMEQCSEPRVVETPADFDKGISAIADAARELTAGRDVRALVAGIAGPLNRSRTHLVNAPHLAGWVGKPLAERLSEELSTPVYLENDTALVALGEAVAGAGAGNEIIVYVTVSTGVGGARIVGGCIDRSRFGFEPGHQVVDLDNTACPKCKPCPKCGKIIDLESMVSGSAIKDRFGREPYEIPQDDELWETLARWLAVGLANTAVHWSPDVMVLGGSMMIGDPRIPLERVRAHLADALVIFPERPELALAKLGDFGGLRGALAYAKTHISIHVP